MKNWAKRAVWGIGLAVSVGCVIVIIKFSGKTENKTITNHVETINTEEAAGTEESEMGSDTAGEEAGITRISDSVFEQSFGEIDGSRVSVQVEQPYEEEGTDYDSNQKLFWNGTIIWEYSEVNYVDPARVEYLDLDEDGEKEIFYTFAPRVNSAGLVEYVVLKQKGDKWQPLQMQQEGNLAENNLPVSVIYLGNYNVEISCEGTDKTIDYNVKEHYERLVEDEIETAKEQGFTDAQTGLYQPYLDDTVAAAGEEYGCLAAFGMWEIKPAIYENEVKNCLVATYGIQGLQGKFDFFGYLDVYFNYDKDGKYQILDLQFEEYDPTKEETDSSENGEEADIGGGDNSSQEADSYRHSYEEVIDEYRDMVQNHFYKDLQAEDREAYEKSFGPDIGEEIKMYEQSVFYAFYDIDGNGTEELIIAAGEPGIGVGNPGFLPTNYDIYTYSDGNVVHIFDNYEFGYRTNFDLCDDGLIEVASNASAAEYDVVFYRIGTDGVSPVVEDVFRCVGTQTGNDTVSFQYTENGKEIAEEEYNQKIENYAKPLEGLEWKEIYQGKRKA